MLITEAIKQGILFPNSRTNVLPGISTNVKVAIAIINLYVKSVGWNEFSTIEAVRDNIYGILRRTGVGYDIDGELVRIKIGNDCEYLISTSNDGWHPTKIIDSLWLEEKHFVELGIHTIELKIEFLTLLVVGGWRGPCNEPTGLFGIRAVSKNVVIDEWLSDNLKRRKRHWALKATLNSVSTFPNNELMGLEAHIARVFDQDQMFDVSTIGKVGFDEAVISVCDLPVEYYTEAKSAIDFIISERVYYALINKPLI